MPISLKFSKPEETQSKRKPNGTMHSKRALSEMFSTRALQKELQLRSLDLPSFAGALLSISSTDCTQDSRTPKSYHTTLTIRLSSDFVLLTLAFKTFGARRHLKYNNFKRRSVSSCPKVTGFNASRQDSRPGFNASRQQYSGRGATMACLNKAQSNNT